MKVIKNLVPTSKYNIKCPYAMDAECIVVHNTYNDASAANEIAYMLKNNNKVSYHYAIDDKEIVQGVPENRNTWNAGDGGTGKGNRKGLAIEICYSKSGGKRFDEAEKLAATFIASKLKEKGWGIDKVKKHQDFSGKYCPHRTLDLGWNRFLNLIKVQLHSQPSKPSTGGLYRVQVGAYSSLQNATNMIAKIKSLWFNTYIVKAGNLYKVQTGAYGNKANADAQVKKLKAKGLDAFITTEQGSPVNTAPTKKSINEIAKEVIKGNWGNGEERKKKLIAAGYNYNEVQKEVNKLLR